MTSFMVAWVACPPIYYLLANLLLRCSFVPEPHNEGSSSTPPRQLTIPLHKFFLNTQSGYSEEQGMWTASSIGHVKSVESNFLVKI